MYYLKVIHKYTCVKKSAMVNVIKRFYDVLKIDKTESASALVDSRSLLLASHNATNQWRRQLDK